jgi:peptidoglycan hydrolase CwlO-like protein
MKKLIVFAMLAGVLYFAINGVLAVVQEASQHTNQEAHATLEAAIAAKREALSALNAHLEALSQQIDGFQTHVDDLEHQMADIKTCIRIGPCLMRRSTVIMPWSISITSSSKS